MAGCSLVPDRPRETRLCQSGCSIESRRSPSCRIWLTGASTWISSPSSSHVLFGSSSPRRRHRRQRRTRKPYERFLERIEKVLHLDCLHGPARTFPGEREDIVAELRHGLLCSHIRGMCSLDFAQRGGAVWSSRALEGDRRTAQELLRLAPQQLCRRGRSFVAKLVRESKKKKSFSEPRSIRGASLVSSVMRSEPAPAMSSGTPSSCETSEAAPLTGKTNRSGAENRSRTPGSAPEDAQQHHAENVHPRPSCFRIPRPRGARARLPKARDPSGSLTWPSPNARRDPRSPAPFRRAPLRAQSSRCRRGRACRPPAQSMQNERDRRRRRRSSFRWHFFPPARSTARGARIRPVRRPGGSRP